MMKRPYADWLPYFLDISAKVRLLAFEPFETHIKKDGSPVTSVDFAAQELLLSLFHRLTPTVPVVSEEKRVPDWKERKTWSTCWITDPIDGTRELVNGNDEFAICAALIQKGRPVFSAILMPAKQESFFAVAGQGAYFVADTAKPVRISPPQWQTQDPIYVLKSRSHHTAHMSRFLKDLIQRLPQVKPVVVGSAYKFCLLARGDVSLYRRVQAINEWDVAAGDLIVWESGGQMRLPDGGLPQYNTQAVAVPGFWAVSSPALAEYLIAQGIWKQ
jgi:3'(2'), 5'-bisphosphate nucleotidase